MSKEWKAKTCSSLRQDIFCFQTGGKTFINYSYLVQIFGFCNASFYYIMFIHLYHSKDKPDICPATPNIEGKICFEDVFRKRVFWKLSEFMGTGFIVCEVFRHFFVGQKKLEFSIVGNKTKAMNFFMSSDFVQLSSLPTFQSNSFRPIW